MRWMLAKLFLRVMGWRFEGALPADRRCVVIAAPHTSGWDMPFLLACTWLLGGRISWMAKNTLFRWPWGFFFRRLGGISVDRSARHQVVEQMAALFRQRTELVLAVAAEGTRAYREYWKSGFYHIARGAGVPIVCSFLDFATRRVGLGLVLLPSGDVSKDMDRIRRFYADKVGKHPERFSRCRLREEDGRLREEDGRPQEGAAVVAPTPAAAPAAEPAEAESAEVGPTVPAARSGA